MCNMQNTAQKLANGNPTPQLVVLTCEQEECEHCANVYLLQHFC